MSTFTDREEFLRRALRAARCGVEAHSREFREEERRYAHYQRARKFLDR